MSAPGIVFPPGADILIVTRQDVFGRINDVDSMTGTGDCCTPDSGRARVRVRRSLVPEWGRPDHAHIRIIDRETMDEISIPTETHEGRRLHELAYLGLGPALRHQGAAWPGP